MDTIRHDLHGMRPGRTRLLHTWSGGVDSTYTLWRLLALGFDVVSVHVRLTNKWGRDGVEGSAVDDARAWLDAQQLPGRLEVRHVGIDYGTTVLSARTRTIELCRPLAAFTLRDPALQDIRHIVASGIAEDGVIAAGWKRQIHQAVEAAALRPVRLLRPIRRYRKAQIIADMPDQLYAACWSCNHPTGDGRPCGSCSTCRHVATADPDLDPSRPVGVLPLGFETDRPCA